MSESSQIDTNANDHTHHMMTITKLPLKRLVMLLCSIVLLALLSACAGFDASVLDTAKCMGKGSFSTGLVYGMGVQAPEWIEIDPNDIYDSDSARALQSLELKYGWQDDLDLTGRVSANPDGYSGKLLVKKQLYQEDHLSTAFVIGGGYLSSKGDYWEDSYEQWNEKRSSLASGEAQFLATREYSRNSFLTLALRGNIHQFVSESSDGMRRIENFHHAGIRLITGRYYSGFMLMFELGLEAPLSAGEITSVYPWAGYKMAWNWNTKKK